MELPFVSFHIHSVTHNKLYKSGLNFQDSWQKIRQKYARAASVKSLLFLEVRRSCVHNAGKWILSDAATVESLLRCILAHYVDLRGPIRMAASVVVTIRIMPTSPAVDLVALEKMVHKHVLAFTGKQSFKAEQKHVAYGLKALEIMFVMDEAKGSTEELETKIMALHGVNSAVVIDVRRTIG